MHSSISSRSRPTGTVSLLQTLFSTTVLFFSSSVTAYNATGDFNTTLTVWNPSSNAYAATPLNVNLGVTWSGEDNSSEWQDQPTSYVTTEQLWVDDSAGTEICTAPYTLCALAFTGGIGNTNIQTQMANDPGDCSTLFSSACASDLKAAVGTALLGDNNNANATAILNGDVCSGLSTLKVPSSCSAQADVLKQSTSQAIITPMSICGVNGMQPYTIDSFSAPIADQSSVQNQFQQFTKSFTPLIIVSLGGPNGTQILKNEPGTTRSLMCIRPDNMVDDPTDGIPPTGPPATALGAWGIRNFERPSVRELVSLLVTVGLMVTI